MSVNWQINTFAELPSTQDYLRNLIDGNPEPEGLVIQALSQTAGHGRQGRHWHSPMGNLYMSLLLRPECAPAQAGQMAFVVAVAVSAAMDIFMDPAHKKTLKWPNDILIDGKKCAGILIESSLGPDRRVEALIVGVGVNILAPPDGATALAHLGGGRQTPINVVRDQILAALSVEYERWRRDGFSPVRDRWLAQAHGINQPLTARLPGGDQSGVFRGIDENGALLLETPDGQVKSFASAELLYAELS